MEEVGGQTLPTPCPLEVLNYWFYPGLWELLEASWNSSEGAEKGQNSFNSLSQKEIFKLSGLKFGV